MGKGTWWVGPKCCICTKGGGLFEFQTPSKFSNPSFSNLRFWGKGLARKAPKFFFFALPEGGVFVLPYVSILKILRILWRIQKCLKNTEKFLTPDLTSGSSPPSRPPRVFAPGWGLEFEQAVPLDLHQHPCPTRPAKKMFLRSGADYLALEGDKRRRLLK